jgi:hypothetical protein
MSPPTLAVVTPSHAPDLPLFNEMHRSVLRHTDESTVHVVVVNPEDLPRYRGFAGPRCQVLTIQDLLPRTFVPVPGRPLWLHRRRPLPPVRGWVMQQVLKIAVAAALDVDVVLIMDSDVVLVRDVRAEQYRGPRGCAFYRRDDAVHAGMERHVLWHRAARQLLGLPPAPVPLPDYVTSFNVWDPAVVRRMQQRIEEVTSRSWVQAVATRLHVSEFILYGVFVDEVLRGSGVDARSSLGCLEYWDPVPLDEAGARRMVDRFDQDHVSVMVSSKSHTPLAVRDVVLAGCRTRVGDG